MKKVIKVLVVTALAIFLFGGCSKDKEEDKKEFGGLKLSPPAWIHGVWKPKEHTTIAYDLKYKFTANKIFEALVPFMGDDKDKEPEWMDSVSMLNALLKVKANGRVTESKNTDSVYEIKSEGTRDNKKEVGLLRFEKINKDSFKYIKEDYVDGKLKDKKIKDEKKDIIYLREK